MPNGYIAATELGQYGLVGTAPIYIDRASSLIDAVLHRPEGLTWTPDAAGWPCYMTRLTPRLSLNVAGPILPGLNVVVTLTGNIDTNPDNLLGEVIVLDRLVPGAIEACVINGATANTLTLANVLFSHPGPVTFDFGLVITELKNLPDGRPMTHLGSWPIARMHSGVGRYGSSRHTESQYGGFDDPNLLGILRTFGGAAIWQMFPISSASWDVNTGHIWIPVGNWLAYFSEVQIRYVAGWGQSNIPELIKQAVAQLATGMKNNLMPGNVVSYKAGDTQITRAAATVLDADTLRGLKMFASYQFA